MEESQILKRVGINIASMRSMQNVTQEALSLMIGKSTASISAYERGTVKIDVCVMLQLCDALKCDPSSFFVGLVSADVNQLYGVEGQVLLGQLASIDDQDVQQAVKGLVSALARHFKRHLKESEDE